LLAPMLAPTATPVPEKDTRLPRPPGVPDLGKRAGVSRDSVTGLPLRSIAIAEAERMLERAGVLQLKIAAMVLSLDRFRRVNESIGSMAGDVLLRQVAERLRSSVSDTDFVGRRSGDEFVMVIEDLPEGGSPLLI